MADLAPEHHDWQTFKRLLRIILLLFLGIVALGFLYKPVLLGVMSSLIISYISIPFINSLCAKSPIGRKQTIATLIFILVVFITLAAILLLPIIYEETINIFKMVPSALSFLETLAEPLIKWMKTSEMLPEEAIQASVRRLNIVQDMFGANTTVQQIFLKTPVIIEIVFNIAMIPLFSYIFLAEDERIKNIFRMFIPSDLYPITHTFVQRINSVLRSVVKGQFIIAFLLSIFYIIGFSLIDVPSGIAIGAIAGICRLVPYLDVLVGIVLCTVVVLTQSSGLGVFLAALVVIGVVQALDGMIITPRIIGDRAGLHPIVVIASVYAFGSQFGLLGVLLAVPIVAAVSVALQIGWPYFRQSSFFR